MTKRTKGVPTKRDRNCADMQADGSPRQLRVGNLADWHKIRNGGGEVGWSHGSG